MRHDLNNSRESQAMVDFAIQQGHPYFETCYFYLDGKCEEFIYSLLTKYKRDEYELCGKMPVHSILESSTAESVFAEQLQRVPGGYFDVYLLQALDAQCFAILKEKNAIPFLLKQKKLGKIRRLGISIQCGPDIFEQYLRLGCWDIVQMPFNFYDYYCCEGKALYDLAKNYELPIIAQAPQKGGLLPKFIPDATKFAIDWIRSFDNVEYILSGTAHLENYKNTINALMDPLKYTSSDHALANLQQYLDSTRINCISCNRCYKVCPVNLPIQTYFNLYNKCLDLTDESRTYYFNSLDILKKTTLEPTQRCNECGLCKRSCPMNLNIPQIFRNDIWELRT